MNPCMKLFVGTLLCLFLASCTQWELKKIPSETYLAQKWKAISLDEVDTYPSFDFCDELGSKAALRACFENEVTSTFYNSLSAHHFKVSQKLEDTIHIGFEVNEKGLYCIDTLKLSEAVLSEIPQLERWIHEACEQLPQAHPATLRNIPVKTKFKIPLVFQTTD